LFAVRAGSVLSVALRRCDPAELGKSVLCEKSFAAKRIGCQQKVVLHAGFAQDPLQSLDRRSTVVWNTTSDLGTYFLDEENVLSSIYSQTLILKAGAILPGQRVSFRATIQSNGLTGMGELSVFVNVRPVGGILQVSPSTGSAVETDFNVGTRGWTTDAESLPLMYRFFVHTKSLSFDGADAPDNEFLISAGERNEFVSKLPPGNSLLDDELKLSVQVFDIWGSDATVSTNVQVSIPTNENAVALQNEVLVPYLDSQVSHGDDSLLLQSIAVVGGSLNAIADTCEGPEQDRQMFTRASCVLSKPIRSTLRHRLLSVLGTFCGSARPSAANLLSEAVLLKMILDRPEDVSLPSAFRGRDLFRIIQGNALETDEDTADVMDVLGFVLSRMFSVVKVQGTTVARRRARLSLQSDVSSRRAVSAAESDQRLLTRAVMTDLSGVSALMVKTAHAGAKPVVSANDAFTMTSQRVAAGSLSQGPSSFQMDGVKALLPPDILSNLESALSPNTGVDIMMVAWRVASNPVSGSVGPVVGFELRNAGSQSALPLKFPLSSPVQLQVQISINISKNIDLESGKGFAPFVKRFDLDTWDWTADQISVMSATGSSIQVKTTHLSFFSALQVSSGCDGVALSPKIYDHCRICGGDNSTCSGCDWIPNSGRDRTCSGHGQCGMNRCSCVQGWFGIMCENPCRDEIFCSGHGQCEADAGKTCVCDEGWVSEAKYDGTGPYCTRQPGADGLLGKLPENEARASLTMILAISIPVGVIVLIVLCAVWWYVTKQAREAAGPVLYPLVLSVPSSI